MRAWLGEACTSMQTLMQRMLYLLLHVIDLILLVAAQIPNVAD